MYHILRRDCFNGEIRPAARQDRVSNAYRWRRRWNHGETLILFLGSWLPSRAIMAYRRITMWISFFFHPTHRLDWCQPENEQGAILRLVQLGLKGGRNAYDRKAVKECAKRRPNWDACLSRWCIGISRLKIDTPSTWRAFLCKKIAAHCIVEDTGTLYLFW